MKLDNCNFKHFYHSWKIIQPKLSTFNVWEDKNWANSTTPIPTRYHYLFGQNRSEILSRLGTRKALEHSSTWDTRTLQARFVTLAFGYSRDSRHFIQQYLQTISSYYTTVLSNFIGPYPYAFALILVCFVLQRQMRGMGKNNSFCHSTLSFTFDLPGARQSALGKFWKTELALNL